jgi:hypothetical protein
MYRLVIYRFPNLDFIIATNSNINLKVCHIMASNGLNTNVGSAPEMPYILNIPWTIDSVHNCSTIITLSSQIFSDSFSS